MPKMLNQIWTACLFGVWKNLGNILILIFAYWNLEISLINKYTFEEFLTWFLWNLNWFIPVLTIFFIFRFWLEAYKK